MSIYNQRMTKIREKRELCPERGTAECERCKYFADPCFDWMEEEEEE